MSMRIRMARGLLRLGAFIRTLPVAVMKPDDLVEFSRLSYDNPQSVGEWSEDGYVDSGLSMDELDLVGALGADAGDVLVLGLGGGREAIALAAMGHHVTGIDYVPDMVERARENAARRGYSIHGLVQDISRLDAPAGAYDVVWLSEAMYSCVPTRRRRVEMVRGIARALKPGGVFLCQFHWAAGPPPSRSAVLARRIIAVCTLGNLAYEPGDMLWGSVEFIHAFPSEAAVRSELEEGGLQVLRVQRGRRPLRGGAVCVKNPDDGTGVSPG